MSWSFSSSSLFTLTARRLSLRRTGGCAAGGRGRTTWQAWARRLSPPSPERSPTQQPVEPGEEPLAPGAIKVRAESYEQTSKGHVEARGLVDLRVAGSRIQADKADVLEDKQPDGSTKQRIVADGNVVFIRGEERLSGDHLEMDDSGKGVLLNAVGYLEPGVFVKARKIERVDDGQLPRRGRDLQLLLAAEPTLELQRVAGEGRGRRQDHGHERRLQGEGRARLLHALHLLPDQQGPPLDGLPDPEHRLHSACAGTT